MYKPKWMPEWALFLLASLAIGIGLAQIGLYLGGNPTSMAIFAVVTTLLAFDIIRFLAKKAENSGKKIRP